jgi:Kazal-type serine protease inhibitor domain
MEGIMRGTFVVAGLTLLLGTIGAGAMELRKGEQPGIPVCGGFPGYLCSNTEWCDYPDNAACGIGDQIGKCRPRPEFCTEIYLPVCGCNGKTYSNACQAAADGVDAAYAGTCRKDGDK